MIITAAMPQHTPTRTYSNMVCRLTRMPANLAASGLPPTAMVRRPNVVRLSRTQPITDTRAKTYTSTGMPNQSPRKNSTKSRVANDLGLLVRDDLGQSSGADEHRQGRDERDHPAVGDEHAVDQTAAGADGERR